MAQPFFKPAGSAELAARAYRESSIQEWVRVFKLRKDVTDSKIGDGSFDVSGDLDLSNDEIFDRCDKAYSFIKEHIKFNEVGGNFTIRSAELFVVLPRKVKGNIHIVGDLKESIKTVHCKVGGRVIVTPEC